MDQTHSISEQTMDIIKMRVRSHPERELTCDDKYASRYVQRAPVIWITGGTIPFLEKGVPGTQKIDH